MALFYSDALLVSDLSHQIIKVDYFVLHWNVTNPTRQKCITVGQPQTNYGLSLAKSVFQFQDIHKELEEKIAKFHNREAAILYASCFDANAGLFEVLMTKDDAILSDELNHASIIDGIRLSKAQKLKFKHRSLEGKQWP